MERGSVQGTTDGGGTWTEKPLGGDYPTLRSIDFISPYEGWVVGEQGFIAHTVNGGNDWELQASGTSYRLNAVRFLDNQRGYAVGDYIILKTTNGGITWEQETAVRYLKGEWHRFA